MKPYRAYRRSLDDLIRETEWGNRRAGLCDKLHESLNGGAAGALRATVAESVLHRNGAYFTGEKLGRRTVGPLARNVALRQRPVCDPTCGGGDLLLRWAEFLPVSRDLGDTLEEWQGLIHGIDLYHEFLAVAKRRLVLLAIARGARYRGRVPLPLDRFFPGLVVDNILRTRAQVPREATLIMNPPFTYGQAPRACTWAAGRVSRAAVAFLQCVEAASPGTQVSAILPDVLRSGHRYERWRTEVAGRLAQGKVEIVGRFDAHANIDVFLLRGTVDRANASRIDWQDSTTAGKANLGSICSVHVGSVVPHRDSHTGAWHPYITVDDLPAWGESAWALNSRRHWIKGVRPPFVAVRRTSSPGDAERAIGTLVRGASPILAENHLLTLQPTDHSLATCRKILRILRDERTLKWLNGRIRCRHLTVQALKELPIWPKLC